jgi:hypothetical protein
LGVTEDKVTPEAKLIDDLGVADRGLGFVEHQFAWNRNLAWPSQTTRWTRSIRSKTYISA